MAAGYLGIGSRISHPEYGKGVVIQIDPMKYRVMFIEAGEVGIAKDDPNMMLIERVDPDDDPVSLWDIEQSLTRILRKWADPNELVPLGDKWEGGKMILQPGNTTMASKEIPIDQFFHKIVMLRDRLRVMEQRINAHDKLTDEDKVNLQQYLTRIYGSLTTFNVLFKLKEDHFIGDKGK